MTLLEKKTIYNLKVHKKDKILATFSVKLGKGTDNFINCIVWNKLFVEQIENGIKQLETKKQRLVGTFAGYLRSQSFGGAQRVSLQIEAMILKIVEFKDTKEQKELKKIKKNLEEFKEQNKIEMWDFEDEEKGGE